MDLGRGFLAQRLVRADLVEPSAEGVETDLLASAVRCRRPSGVVLQGAVHALVAAILLWFSRLDPVGADAELDPPHAQG